MKMQPEVQMRPQISIQNWTPPQAELDALAEKWAGKPLDEQLQQLPTGVRVSDEPADR